MPLTGSVRFRDVSNHHGNTHRRLLHLNPLVKVLVEPDHSSGVPPIQIAVMAMLVPPSGLVELGAVRRAHVVVAVQSTERHQVRVPQCICSVSAKIAQIQPVEGVLGVDSERRVVGQPIATEHIPHVDSQSVDTCCIC